MSAGQEDTGEHELVIIRRRHHDEDEGHHGGVWKIAYADFMTAMMAFFLVMWLINATDEETLTQVANYFNPLPLSDKIASTKGLNDMESGAKGAVSEAGAAKTKTGDSKGDPETAPGRPKFTEEALYKDPLGALDMLAHEVTPTDAEIAKNQKAVHNGADGKGDAGDAYRDPFNPSEQIEASVEQGAPALPSRNTRAAAPMSAKAPDAAAKTPDNPSAANETVPPAVGEPQISATGPAEKPNLDKSAALEQTAPPPAAQPAEAAKPPAEPKPENAQAATRAAEGAELSTAIKQLFEGAAPGTIPHVDVTLTEEGLLISLTDEFDFGMFASGSAEPNPALVVVMEKIAKLLEKHQGGIVLRGHTDARPYRSGSYDNWRLSAARAHMAYYMLLRGGIPEQRFERIEGYADHSLRIPASPEAAQNRRIEILLRKPKP
jgi:chemotaxis protein MotB